MNKLKAYFNKERLIIFMSVLLFYGNILKNDYSLDDSIVTEKDNITSKGFRAIPKLLKSYYLERADNMKFEYRPIVKISFAIEHQFFGVNVIISHFFNLLLYIIGLYVLFSVLKLLFNNYSPHIAFYSVLLFAIMPIHSEVVASLKNRDILICFILCMLSFKYYLIFLINDQKKWKFLLFSAISFYIAFLTKFDVLPFIAIIPILAYIKKSAKIKHVILFFGLAALTAVLFKLTKYTLLEKDVTKRVFNYFENPLFFEKGMSYKLIALCNSLGFYIQQSIFPIKQCSYYGIETISVSKLQFQGIIGIISIPLLSIGIIKTFLKKDFVIFSGLFIFCASVSIYLNFVIPVVGIVADRFAFFNSIGIAILFIGLYEKYKHKINISEMNLKILGGAIFIFFTVITINRNCDWKNLNTLTTADVNKFDKNVFLNYKQGLNLATESLDKNNKLTNVERKNKLIEARKYLEKSITLYSNYPSSLSYLSYILIYYFNEFGVAIPYLNKAISLKPTTELFFYKAICMRETKQKDSSEFFLKKCLALDLNYLNAYNLLMYDYNESGQFEKTIALCNNAINAGVNAIEIYNTLGKTYWQMKNNVEAVKYYKKALEINPSNEEALTMVKKLL